jgi:hypothetical protein
MRTKNMSEQLRNKLSMARAKKKMTELISSVQGLTFIDYESDLQKIPSPALLWRRITPIDAVPSKTIRLDAARSDLLDWVLSCLKQANIYNEFYISIGGIAQLPWVKVQVSDSNWMSQLWDALGILDIILLSHDKKCLAAFSEEEHLLEAYIIEL